jgi:hypothetical protein
LVYVVSLDFDDNWFRCTLTVAQDMFLNLPGVDWPKRDVDDFATALVPKANPIPNSQISNLQPNSI